MVSSILEQIYNTQDNEDYYSMMKL